MELIRAGKKQVLTVTPERRAVAENSGNVAKSPLVILRSRSKSLERDDDTAKPAWRAVIDRSVRIGDFGEAALELAAKIGDANIASQAPEFARQPRLFS